MGAKESKPATDFTATAESSQGVEPASCVTEITVRPAAEKERKSGGEFGENSMAGLDDFEILGERPIDFGALLQHSAASITPYCLDHIRRRVIYVKCDAKTILEGTFLYTGQRKFATTCYGVPYKNLYDIVEPLMTAGWDKNVGHLYSTGRCGSTLLSKVLDQGKAVMSISEPEVYSYVTWLLSMDSTCFDDVDLPRLLRGVTWSLMNFAKAYDPKTKIILLKYRSQVVELAPVLKRALPNSKGVFLYRDPMATAESFCKGFLTSWVTRAVRWLNLDSYFVYSLSGWERHFNYLMPFIRSDIAPPKEIYTPLGFPGFTTMIWLSTMDSALRLSKDNVWDAVIRYEDLCKHRLQVVNKLLQACRFEQTIADKADNVFDEDAHDAKSGGIVGRSKDPNAVSYIPLDDCAKLLELLNHHAELTSLGFLIPGTLEFE